MAVHYFHKDVEVLFRKRIEDSGFQKEVEKEIKDNMDEIYERGNLYKDDGVDGMVATLAGLKLMRFYKTADVVRGEEPPNTL